MKRQARQLPIFLYMLQGRNLRENLDATYAMVGKICPRVKISENLGATLVAPVAPVDTSLRWSYLNQGVVWADYPLALLCLKNFCDYAPAM